MIMVDLKGIESYVTDKKTEESSSFWKARIRYAIWEPEISQELRFP